MQAVRPLSYGTEFWSNIFDAVTYPAIPLLSADDQYLKKVRLVHKTQNKIREFRSMDLDIKLKIMDILTDWVSDKESLEDPEEFGDDLLDVLKGMPEVDELVMVLKTQFKAKLNTSQQEDLIRHMVRIVSADVRVLYTSIRDDIRESNKKDLGFLIVSKQVMYEVVKHISDIESKLERKRGIPGDVLERLNLSLYLLLRLEAARLGKLKESQLHDDLTYSSQYSNPILNEASIGTVYDVLGYSET